MLILFPYLSGTLVFGVVRYRQSGMAGPQRIRRLRLDARLDVFCHHDLVQMGRIGAWPDEFRCLGSFVRLIILHSSVY